METAILAIAFMSLCLLALLVWRTFRQPTQDLLPAIQKLNFTVDAIVTAHAESGRHLREEVANANKNLIDTFIRNNSELQQASERTTAKLEKAFEVLMEKVTSRLDSATEASIKNGKELQKSIQDSMNQATQANSDAIKHLSEQIQKTLSRNEESTKDLAVIVAKNLTEIRNDNDKKLESIRAAVDEKLQSTLEKRLGESFKLVSDRLEAVQRGLGEMQNLAVGVGDLKRVLTNVSARGAWGEVQLVSLLEQVLTTDQYVKNYAPDKMTSERVEYAIKIPAPKGGEEVFLPLDSKFPLEVYENLLNAQEAGDKSAIDTHKSGLRKVILDSAKNISTKYIQPPHTTDFAVLFLPVEGLFAEVLRIPGLIESTQNQHRVVICGPTTFAATLSTLRMGFRTMAIEQRSAEVWQILSAVKSEFGKFGDVLIKVKRQLATASKTIAETETRTRQMQRKLVGVETIPSTEAEELLNLAAPPVVEPQDESDLEELS